jgi:large subunit ribosomal protein L29
MPLSKIADLRQLGDSEIADKILDLKKQLFDLRLQQATRQEVKSHQFKHIRHELAQLMTIERERSSNPKGGN